MKVRDRLTIQTSLVVIIVIVALVYALIIKPNYYNFNGGEIFFETVSTESFSSNGIYQTYTYNQYLYISSQNGLKKVSLSGESVWDKVFYVKNPLFLYDKQYMVVVDIGGKDAFAFDDNGLMKEYHTDLPIILADLSGEGALVLVQENDDKNFIQLYNRIGTLVAERHTNFSLDGYPLAITLSSTGGKMVTSNLSVKEGVMESVITFFAFPDPPTKNPEKMVGIFVLEDTVVPEIQFLDDEHLVAIGDNSINFYQVKDLPKLNKQITLHNEIEQVVINNNNVILYYGSATGVADTDLEGHVFVYNFEGEKIDDYLMKLPVKKIIGQGKNYYVVTDKSVEYHNSTKMIWHTTTYKDIKNILKIGKDNYLFVYQRGYEILKIKDI